MAFIKPFEGADGVALPECYWRPVRFSVRGDDRLISVTFLGYRDAAARASGKRPVAGAERTYTASGPAFDSLYLRHLQGENFAALAYEHALTTKDVPAPNPDHDPADPDAAPEFLWSSYFDGAAQA